MEFPNSTCPPIEVLDFRPHNPCFNAKNVTRCHDHWPCELREYWLHMHAFVDVSRACLSYGTIIIVVMGVFLNVLSFYTLIRSGLAKNGSGVYLLALAVCDTLNLLFNYAIGVARGEYHEFNKHFKKNQWLCRSHGVAVDIFQTMSAWIVICFTVERCIAVWYPMGFRRSRKQRSKIVVGILSVIFVLFTLSKLFLTGFENDSVFGYEGCSTSSTTWNGIAYIRIAFQTWIPTFFIFVFNCFLFWKLGEIRKRRDRLTAYRHRTSTKSANASNFNNHSNSTRHHKSTNRTSPMLIAVSLAYLILVFPLGLVQSIEIYWDIHNRVHMLPDETNRDEYLHWKKIALLLKHIRSFCFSFYQINFCINFFLYFAAGTQFRAHLQAETRRLFTACGFFPKKQFEAQRRVTTTVSNRTVESAVSTL